MKLVGEHPNLMKNGLAPTPVLFAFLLAVGAVLRLARPDLVAFKLDEAKFIGIVDAAAFGEWPSAGAMSSWGILQPPLRAYLLAPARWLTDDVAAVPALLGLFSFANLVATGLCAARFSGAAAVAAVGLAAASPWVLHFGRALWDAPIQLFGTLALYASIRAVQTGNARWTLTVMPLLLLQTLTHLTAWSALPIAAYLCLRHPLFRSRWFGGGTALGLALVLPYALMLLTTPQAFGPAAPTREPWSPGTALTALEFASWFVSGADLQALLGVAHAPTYPFSGALAVGPFIAGALLLLGLAALAPSPVLQSGEGTGGEGSSPRTRTEPGADSSVRRRTLSPALPHRGGGFWGSTALGDPAAAEVVLAWALIPLLATMVLPGHLFLHYFQVWGGGAPFVLMGLGAAWLWTRLRRGVLRGAGGAALLAVPVIQAAAWLSLLGYLDSVADTALGPTLGAWQGLAGSAHSAAAGQPWVQVWAEGEQPAFQDQPAVLQLLLGKDVPPVFAPRDSLLLREAGATAFITTPPRGPPKWGFDDPPGLRSLATTLAGTVWTAGPPLSPPVDPRDAIEFQDGIAYLGSSFRRADSTSPGRLDLVTFWRGTSPTVRARTADITLFVHLEAADGTRLAQRDGLDWPSDQWAPEVRFAQLTTLAVSQLPGEGRVRIGFYSRQDLQRSLRLDDGSDSIVIPVPQA